MPFLQTSCAVSRRVFPLKFGNRRFGTLNEKENIAERNYRLSRINNGIALLVLARRKRRSPRVDDRVLELSLARDRKDNEL